MTDRRWIIEDWTCPETRKVTYEIVDAITGVIFESGFNSWEAADRQRDVIEADIGYGTHA